MCKATILPAGGGAEESPRPVTRERHKRRAALDQVSVTPLHELTPNEPAGRMIDAIPASGRSPRWPAFAEALANGSLEACSSSATGGYCYWTRVPLINVSAVCPINRRCGRTERRWLPPHKLSGFREFSSSQGSRCLRNRWLLFVGDSHARTAFNVLLHLLGRSPWPGMQHNESLWASSAWPTMDTLGPCGGGRAGSLQPLPLVDALRERLAWNVSSSEARAGCTRDYTLPSGVRVSFVFLSRLREQWAAVCDLVRGFSRGAAPSAIILSYSAWPMLDAPSSLGECDVSKYYLELRRLVRMLLLGRTSPLIKAAACVADGVAGTDGPSLGHFTPPALFWLGQTRMASHAAQRCLADGRWTGAQRAALASLTGAATSGRVHHLDAWHLVDSSQACPMAADRCMQAPSPRLRDDVHYHMPVYLAIVHNLLNRLCL